MFNKILIANRGEIACRIIRTAQAMGIATVAIYSEADATALHVEMADEAIALAGNTAAETYLNISEIIAACKETGAEAVHPGYGFLSENPEFVEALTEAGIVFVGPSAQAIRSMGLKDAAKALMEGAGVPVVPGYHGTTQDDAFLAKEATRIGYPVMIKAVAGGGGKGMRIVDTDAEFQSALLSARSEALGAFGNGAVLIEKYVSSPRHIEMQVFGDGTNVVHLFERDCSLQRRHQKVIEESPAPGMTTEMRNAMGRAAVNAAKAIGYSGAGTVEFIVDGSDGLHPDKFWFMEMNTRLQVEHPVTEAVTGVDLVEWQLRVASGEGLPKEQSEISLCGHAFEARLYAEDVAKGFLPAIGHLRYLKFPSNCRVETGVKAGDEISAHYDPMIAKIITHGEDRSSALGNMTNALKELKIAGTSTNLGFLGAISEHDAFKNSEIDTGFIPRHLTQLTAHKNPAIESIAQAALFATGLDRCSDLFAGFSIWKPVWQNVMLGCDEEVMNARYRAEGPNSVYMQIDGAEVACKRSKDGWLINEVPSKGVFSFEDTVTVFSDYGQVFHKIDALECTGEGGSESRDIIAPMPGLVRAVHVKAGQKVVPGDVLAILEAMKMEHSLTVETAAVIGEVLVAENAQVAAGDLMIKLEDTE